MPKIRKTLESIIKELNNIRMIDFTRSHLVLFGKPLLQVLTLILLAIVLTGCAVNPATGKRQFTGFLSPEQARRIGAQEHKNIVAQYGLYENEKVNAYVQEIGQKVAADTERGDVEYKFYVLDSPIVNAFAVPGGYIYVTRGLLALAGSEAELAAVLAHETGHITGKHSAERYSHGVLASVGTAVLSAAVDKGGVSKALGLGSNLYMKSYSRTQENEADTLGLRYMTRAGYDPAAMSSFLEGLHNHAVLQSRISGDPAVENGVAAYFSTHPQTKERVAKTRKEAQAYTPAPGSGVLNRPNHLSMIDGMIFGDSPRQGFVRGQTFAHPEIGFEFNVPDGFRIENQPKQVVATDKEGAVILFDMVQAKQSRNARSYLSEEWMKGQDIGKVEDITVNLQEAATAAFPGAIKGVPVTIRVVVIEWKPKVYARFQIAIPQGTSSGVIEDMKRSTYSFRRIGDAEKEKYQPYRVHLVTAGAGDSVSRLARQQVFEDYNEDWFRVLNGMKEWEKVQAGSVYKIVK